MVAARQRLTDLEQELTDLKEPEGPLKEQIEASRIAPTSIPGQGDSFLMRTFRRGTSFGRFVVALIGVFLLLGGIGGLWTWVNNRTPLEISTQEYVSKQPRPSAKWVKLKGCYLDLSEAAYAYNKETGKISSLFIPVRPIQERGQTSKVSVVMETDNILLVDLVQRLVDPKSDMERRAIAERNQDKLFQETDISGLVHSGKLEEKLASLQANLTSDFVILKDGKRPEPLMAGLFLVLGVGILIAARYSR